MSKIFCNFVRQLGATCINEHLYYIRMRRDLYISQVGPITGEVKLNLRRYNVFIGPQSSGKSTIAKLISSLSWMEKEACTTLSEDILPAGKNFKEFVEDYHRMHGYIDEDSVIKYDSDYVNIVYDRGAYKLTLKEKCTEYTRVKVSYVPSDRNVITMRDIELRNLEETNFRSFLFDWLEARRSFNSTRMADILALDVKYYFDQDLNVNQDRITHHNGKTYDISLYDASSGLQSAVPLVVLVEYLKDQYYKNYGKVISFDVRKREELLITRLLERILVPAVPHEQGESLSDIYTRVSQEIRENGRDDYKALIEHVQKSFSQLRSPRSIAYIIEEPEQNLFPQTQSDLMQNIVSACNEGEHLSSAVITTHSPYVLAMLNIQILAGILVAAGVDKEVINKVIPVDGVIQAEEIGVYTVGDGTCKSIQNKQTGMIDQNYLDTASENNAAMFDKLYRLFIKTLQR